MTERRSDRAAGVSRSVPDAFDGRPDAGGPAPPARPQPGGAAPEEAPTAKAAAEIAASLPVPAAQGAPGTRSSRVLEMVAHELRNPLAGVSGILELLRESVGSPQAPVRESVELVDTALGEIRRIASILSAVVEAERSGTVVFAARRSACDLREIVQAAVRPMLRGPHPIILESDEPRAIQLRGDQARLEQVFRNLLGNAAKYSPPGALIRISLRRSERAVRVSVRDHGCGIPTSERERIFDQFYRASNVDRRGPGGAGLGLYLCRQIVAAHGGRIWAESNRGGSTFHVELPVDDACPGS